MIPRKLSVPQAKDFCFIVFLLSFLSFTGECRKFAQTVVDASKTILMDDYGRSLTESDCPSNFNDPPKFLYKNDSYFSSTYFSLSCLAPYPITIDFDGKKPFIVNSVRLRVANSDPFNKTKIPCYIVNLNHYLYGGDQNPIGNFTCHGMQMQDKDKSSQIYIFAQSSWRYMRYESFNVPRGLTIPVNQDLVSQFIVPCVATKPDITGSKLSRELTSGQELEILGSFGFQYIYDIYKGFTVSYQKPQEVPPVVIHVVDPNVTTTPKPAPKIVPVVGKYICVDPNNALGNSEVIVEHREVLAFPNNTNLTFGDGQVTLECYASNPVSISITSQFSTTPKVEIIEHKESGTMDSEISGRGYKYYAKAVISTKDPNGTAMAGVSCKTTNNPEKTLFTWQIDNGYKCQCSWNVTYNSYKDRGHYHPAEEEQEFGEGTTTKNPLSDMFSYYYFEPPYITGQMTCTSRKASKVEFFMYTCKNPVECAFYKRACERDSRACELMRDRYIYYDGSTPSNTTTRRMQLLSGMFECSADGYKTNMDVTTDLNGEMYFDDKPSKGTQLLTIMAPETHVYMGDRLPFACIGGTRGNLMGPILWGFKFKKGGYNISEYNMDNHNYPFIDHERTEHLYSVSVLRSTYLDIPNSAKLVCFARKWNSSEFANVSINLQLEDAQVSENPPRCPSPKEKPSIVMFRNSSSPNIYHRVVLSVRLPHIVTEKSAFVFPPVENVHLYCLSKFPTIWMKDGVNVTTARQSRSNCRLPDGTIKSRYLYKVTYVFNVNSLNATGLYTCRSVTPHQSRSSSTYIYARGTDNRTTFVNEGAHHIIQKKWSKDDKWVTLPCRVNTPDFTPHLFIDLPDEERVERVRAPGKFDPKAGFTIDITNRKIVKGNRTIFFCSDHIDGHFIGIMMTLELSYDKPVTLNASLTTTSTPRSGETTVTSRPLNVTTTTPPSATIVSAAMSGNDGSNTGLIVTTVLLCIFCVACVAVIYILYGKVKVQERKNAPGQELDWTRATNNHSLIGNGTAPTVHRNGVVTSISTQMNPGFTREDTPPIIEPLGNNLLPPEILENEDRNSPSLIGDQDRSLPSLHDNGNDFGYQKL